MSKSNGNGKKKSLRPTSRDVRLASAIGQAVQESIGPRLDAIGAEIRDLRTEHGKKLDQLIVGSVGIGRMAKLEERVTALERRVPIAPKQGS